MIPHYRCVRGTDDGCAIYQCLLCGETWEWRGGSAPVRFCIFCGGPLISKLDCREQDTPRWLYNFKTDSVMIITGLKVGGGVAVRPRNRVGLSRNGVSG